MFDTLDPQLIQFPTTAFQYQCECLFSDFVFVFMISESPQGTPQHLFKYFPQMNPPIAFCRKERTLADDAAPYLYPCVVEFCLISAAILYKMYHNVGASIKSFGHICPEKHKIGMECHKANTGLFLGLFVFTLAVIGTFVFMLYKVKLNPLTDIVTIYVYYCSDLALTGISILAVSVAFYQINKLFFTGEVQNKFDQNLLLLAIAGYYMLLVFITIPAIVKVTMTNVIGILAKFQCALSLVSFLQATLQVVFIVDGLRRRALSSHDLKHKPGRSIVTFLLICNMTMWVVNTFELRAAHISPLLAGFYGSLPWTIIMHLCFPLAIFFRFHSAICLSDIWFKAYKPKCTCVYTPLKRSNSENLL